MTNNNYFSFANTHLGCVSYAQNIFNPHEFDKIYIVKGILAQDFMSQIAQKYDTCECFVNPINPQKIDGIIINKTAVIADSIASIDDSHFPAVIVNLNEFCDESMLSAHKENILNLSKKRQDIQISLQRCLKAANELVEYLLDLSVKYLDEKKLSSAIDRILSKRNIATNENDVQNDYRFINSSIGNELNSLEHCTSKILYISNECFLGFHFMKTLLPKIPDSKIICPDALNNERTHAIYSKKDNILFKLQSKLNEKIDDEKYSYINMERFIHPSFKKENKQKLKFIKKIYDSLIKETSDCFNELRDIDSQIEEIYSSSVNNSAQQKFVVAFIKKL